MNDVHFATLLIDTGLMSIFLLTIAFTKKVHFGHTIPFSTARGKMEGCERCPLCHSTD